MTGVGLNRRMLFGWYEMAAKYGNSYAMYCLGEMYEKGDEVQREYNESLDGTKNQLCYVDDKASTIGKLKY